MERIEFYIWDGSIRYRKMGGERTLTQSATGTSLSLC